MSNTDRVPLDGHDVAWLISILSLSVGVVYSILYQRGAAPVLTFMLIAVIFVWRWDRIAPKRGVSDE